MKDSRNVKPTAFHPEILEIPPRQSAMGSLPPGKCSVYIERDGSATAGTMREYVQTQNLSRRVTNNQQSLHLCGRNVFVGDPCP